MAKVPPQQFGSRHLGRFEKGRWEMMGKLGKMLGIMVYCSWELWYSFFLGRLGGKKKRNESAKG